jgi:SAM-dependent methyltransferase
MNEIKHNRDNCFIFDNSKTFLDYSSKKLSISNKNIFQGDLFDMPFTNKFELITCMHTLFAFDEFEKIITNLVTSLSPNGILICDVFNKHLMKNFPLNDRSDKVHTSDGWSVDDITDYCSKMNCELIEIIPHDYYDSQIMMKWLRTGGFISKKFKTYVWRFINKLYFKYNLFTLFNIAEDKEQISKFNKLIIVIRKK